MNNTFYQEDNFEDEAYDGRTAYERDHRRIAILVLIGEEDFLFLIMIGEEETKVLMNIE